LLQPKDDAFSYSPLEFREPAGGEGGCCGGGGGGAGLRVGGTARRRRGVTDSSPYKGLKKPWGRHWL